MDSNSGENTGFKAIYSTIISVLILIVGLFIPVLTVASLILSPLPLVMLVFKGKKRSALFSVLICLIITIVVAVQLVSIPVTTLSFILISFILIVFALGIAFKNRWNFKFTVLVSSGAYLASFIAAIIIGGRLEGINKIEAFISKMFDIIKISMNEAITIFEESGIRIDDFNVMMENLDTLEYIITLFIPGIIIVFSALLGYTAVMIIRYLLKKRGLEHSYIPSFQYLRLSKRTAVFYIILFILVIFIRNNPVSAVLINILFILSFAMTICGLAVADFFVKRSGIPGFLRGIIYMILFMTSSMLSILVPFFHPVNVLMFIGLMDTIFNVRKIDYTGDEI